jgi:hypothetical protein
VIYVAGIVGAIALLLLFFESTASADTTAAAAPDGTGTDGTTDYQYPPPPADIFSNSEVGDVIMGSSGSPVTPDKVSLLAQAIATAEGFFSSDPNVIPRRAHNPGDLTKSFGQPTNGIANSEGVLIFSNDDAGWSALKGQVTAMLTGASHIYSPVMTLRTVAAHYTTRDGVPTADSDNWASNAARVLGISPDQTLKDFLAL